MREKHANATTELLNTILDNRNLVNRFMKATEKGDECPEDLKKEMEAAGIMPDLKKIQTALSEYGKKLSLMATRYTELAGRRNRNNDEKRELRELERKLTAKGLDPKHRGLAERAAILDNKKVINEFLDETERNGFASESLIKALKKLGIRPERGHIIRVQREITQNAKAAERLKHSTKCRAQRDDATLNEELELAASEDDDAEDPEETEEVDTAETA